MPARSLNKVQLIGNLTRDPELRYTPQGTAVCTFGLATNRTWVTESGEKREETEFHRVVAWNKLAELCSQLLFKGRKVFVEGRLQTREWTGKDGTPHQTTEVVISDMIILDSKRAPGEEAAMEEAVPEETAPSEEAFEMPEAGEPTQPATVGSSSTESTAKGGKPSSKNAPKKEEAKEEEPTDENQINPDDIPF